MKLDATSSSDATTIANMGFIVISANSERKNETVLSRHNHGTIAGGGLELA